MRFKEFIVDVKILDDVIFQFSLWDSKGGGWKDGKKRRNLSILFMRFLMFLLVFLLIEFFFQFSLWDSC
jgi:hypothetical protein